MSVNSMWYGDFVPELSLISTKDMYLKIMKFTHTLFGAILLIAYIFLPYTGFLDIASDSGLINAYMKPSLLILLVNAACNLFTGCYTGAGHGIRGRIRATASFLILIAGVLCIFAVADDTALTFETTSVILVATALLLHLALSVKTLNITGGSVRNNSDRETGTVKWFNNSKGFGFITRDKGSDIFVHYRAIRGRGHRTLLEGQRVEFTVAKRNKGLQAEDVIAASGNF